MFLPLKRNLCWWGDVCTHIKWQTRAICVMMNVNLSSSIVKMRTRKKGKRNLRRTHIKTSPTTYDSFSMRDKWERERERTKKLWWYLKWTSEGTEQLFNGTVIMLVCQDSVSFMFVRKIKLGEMSSERGREKGRKSSQLAKKAFKVARDHNNVKFAVSSVLDKNVQKLKSRKRYSWMLQQTKFLGASKMRLG